MSFFPAGECLSWQCTTEWNRKCRVTGRHDSRFGKTFFPRTLQELCSIIFCVVLPSSNPNQELRPVFCNVAFFAVSLYYSQLRTTGWNSDRWVSRRKVCSLKWAERSSASFFFLKSKSVHFRLCLTGRFGTPKVFWFRTRFASRWLPWRWMAQMHVNDIHLQVTNNTCLIFRIGCCGMPVRPQSFQDIVP